ncbi:hypothetical protein PICST_52747 [Scheffersomyces stipitis CBS 6054]|uniref:DASH complex subunit DAD2 n=1 Tax=Scheffersomyces stipitis (strain ATCC 58785 / CBS 6054 / NBRC 10063 / NRRL Y-11545) TaxID=322104 RepID=A3GG39_PICST|nr:predicted protein [Scheffersomyces stipitis CBS 6054]EAZ63865.2 hypothetical protein PICST_52747 [Scheffersomyces stipitis CBS 6054]KAG2735388.1 hypothetical protein G9P44_001602 [Scheffersomyces stipitis]
MSKNIYHQKIAEKKADLARLQEFRELTGELASYLESIGNNLETMKGGAEGVALILANWQNVIKSISLASIGLMKYSDKDYTTDTPFPEPLVRIKLDRDDETTEDNEEGSSQIAAGIASDDRASTEGSQVQLFSESGNE